LTTLKKYRKPLLFIKNMLLLLLNDKKAVFLGVRFHWRFKGVLSSLLQWKRRSDLKRQNAKVYKVEMLIITMKTKQKENELDKRVQQNIYLLDSDKMKIHKEASRLGLTMSGYFKMKALHDLPVEDITKINQGDVS